MNIKNNLNNEKIEFFKYFILNYEFINNNDLSIILSNITNDSLDNSNISNFYLTLLYNC